MGAKFVNNYSANVPKTAKYLAGVLHERDEWFEIQSLTKAQGLSLSI
jgi:hypothetical protein